MMEVVLSGYKIGTLFAGFAWSKLANFSFWNLTCVLISCVAIAFFNQLFITLLIHAVATF
jgi:hypothetical protein